MTAAPVVFLPPGTVETRQERAHRRVQILCNAVQSAFEVLAEIYRDEDWRYVNDAAGRPYTGFTAFVQDQLGWAASNARRYQQGIVGLLMPLQELAAPGTRIPVSSSDVARLGVTGARVVVEQAPSVLDGITDPERQTEALRELIEAVKSSGAEEGFGPVSESTAPETPPGALVPAAVPDSADDHPDDESVTVTYPAAIAAGDAFADDSPPWDVNPTEQRSSGSYTGEAAWDSDTSEAANSSDTAPPPPPASGRDSAGHVFADLQKAIDAVLAAGDPAALAAQLPEGRATALAPKCVASGQRLVRLGQILHTLS